MDVDRPLLTPGEALDTLWRLAGEAPEEHRPRVAAWGAWEMPSWAAWAPYAHRWVEAVAERWGDRLTEPQRALVLAADARALLGAGAPAPAAERAAEAEARAGAWGADAMQRLARAVRVRALAAGGRASEALAARQAPCPAFPEGIPASFLREERLADATARLLSGDDEGAAGAAGDLLATRDDTDLAAWQGALGHALRAGAHARRAAFRPAVEDLDRALDAAREAGSPAETAAFGLARGAWRLACGHGGGAGDLEAALADLQGVGTAAGVAVLAGLPLDPGGLEGPQALVEALAAAAGERIRLRDAAGAALAALAAAGLLARLGAPDVAALVAGNTAQALDAFAPAHGEGVRAGREALGV